MIFLTAHKGASWVVKYVHGISPCFMADVRSSYRPARSLKATLSEVTLFLCRDLLKFSVRIVYLDFLLSDITNSDAKFNFPQSLQ